MSTIELCVVILVVTFIPIAMFLVIFLRAASSSVKKMEELLKEVNDTLKKVQISLEKADQSLAIVNSELPQIMGEAAHTMANLTGITGQVNYGIKKGVTFVERISLATTALKASRFVIRRLVPVLRWPQKRKGK